MPDNFIFMAFYFVLSKREFPARLVNIRLS